MAYGSQLGTKSLPNGTRELQKSRMKINGNGRWLILLNSYQKTVMFGSATWRIRTTPNESDNGSLAHILATPGGGKLLGITTNQEKPDFDSRGPGEESQMLDWQSQSVFTKERNMIVPLSLERESHSPYHERLSSKSLARKQKGQRCLASYQNLPSQGLEGSQRRGAWGPRPQMNPRLHIVLYFVRFPILSHEISKEALPLWLVKSTPTTWLYYSPMLTSTYTTTYEQGTKVIKGIKDGISTEDHHCAYVSLGEKVLASTP
ncbi:uncharacterized protein CLUP02_15150 [Colletotrichum lupini]|uniref:Uncharacterized protein n=1 Tax=Colletotrichum lupini TaxID=145971 RepID=A0A9Q8WN97_9PEZI|nr:uncharacterized protein CLUP02_15150 [Colletotrichum lupini]UQC89619.1 hypothetical protein CLUP02_15150 [Colletotrichum lupini]